MKFDLKEFEKFSNCFLTGTFVWSSKVARDVDIVVPFENMCRVKGYLTKHDIDFEDGTYHFSLVTKKSYVINDYPPLMFVADRPRPLNFIFLGQLDYLKWKKATELMSMLDVPRDRTKRHAIFEMLCSVSALCQTDILSLHRF